MLIEDYEINLFCPPCDPGSEVWVANVKVDADLTDVMPYVNACVKRGYYDPKVPTLVWREGAHKFFLKKNELGINNLRDRAHAERKARKLVEMINDIWERRREIEPDTSSFEPPSILEVFKLLPGTNCKKCGLPTCIAYAAKLTEGEKRLEDCPPLGDPEGKDALEKLRKLGL